jgi:sugar-phosphatase
MIKAVIFDMDGLLLDSEPFWKEAEIKVFNKIGVPLTSEMCDTTVGIRVEEVTLHWHKIYNWDINLTGNSIDEVSNRVIDEVVNLINKKAVPFDGVEYIIEFFKTRNIKTAIASSSSMKIINAAIEKFGIKNKFEVIHSAEFEEYGKPHPAVYLSTAKLLGELPGNCLAFEDSYNGLLAAKNAGMKTVVIPEKRFLNDSRFDIADLKLTLLKEFGIKHLEILNKL